MNFPETAFLFLIYSFAGWAAESVSKSILAKRPVNSGFLGGPFCPVYGFGGFIVLLLGRFSDALFPGLVNSGTFVSFAALFLIFFVILTAWEYIVGTMLEKAFHVRYWDYSGVPLNYKGRICLKNSIYWGIMGLLFIKFFIPWQNGVLLPAIKAVPQTVLISFDIAAYSLLLADIIVSVQAVAGLGKALDKVKELSDIIKMRTEELEFHPTAAAREFAGAKIHMLKIRQTRLKLRLSSYAERIRNAYPTVKSELLGRIKLPDFDKKALKNKLSELKHMR